MTIHHASCRCGQLSVSCEGEPARVSVCHCLDCQKRTGSAFSAQARWPEERVQVSGEAREWVRIADSGRSATYRFCPECGSTVLYTNEGFPGLVAVPLGAFAGESADGGEALPAPGHSVYEHRKKEWVAVLGEEVERSATVSAVRHRVENRE